MSNSAITDQSDAQSAPKRAAGSSFYAAMRILPACAARGDVRDLFVLPRGRRHRRRRRPRERARVAQLDAWRADIDALYAGQPRAAARRARRRRWRRSACSARISSPSSTAWRWTSARRHPGARLGDARSLLRPGRERGRAAVGAGVRHERGRRRRARASSRPRAAAHQYPARSRRGRRRSTGSICRARRCVAAGIDGDRSAGGRRRRPSSTAACAPVDRRARRRISREAARDHDAHAAPRACARRGSWARPIAHPRPADGARLGAAAGAAQARPSIKLLLIVAALRPVLMTLARVHVIGAGLAGPRRRGASLPTRARRVVVHEASPQAGGRCRSYFDADARHGDRQRQPSGAVGQSCGAGLCSAHRRRATSWSGRRRPTFPFIDLATGERWTLDAERRRRFPGGCCRPDRRVPGTRRWRLSRAGAAAAGRPQASDRRGASACKRRRCGSGWSQPFLLAALNTEPRRGSAALAAAGGARDAGGGRRKPTIRWSRAMACRNALVEPALAYLRGARRRDRASGTGCARSVFEGDRRQRRSISATSSVDAARRRRGHPGGAAAGRGARCCRALRRRPSSAPSSTRITASTRRRPAADHRHHQRRRPNGCSRFPDRLSVTISGADACSTRRARSWRQTHLGAMSRRWRGWRATLPPWQIVRERRATFAATPQEDAQRPRARNDVGQSVPGRRLDRHRACRRRSRARSGRAICAAESVDRYSQGSS